MASAHAVDRYLARVGGPTAQAPTQATRLKAAETIVRRVERGTVMWCQRRSDGVLETYLYDCGVVFVVVGQVVVTCYPHSHKKVRRMYA